MIAAWLPQPVDKVVAGVDLTLHARDNREGILHEREGSTTKAIWTSSSVTVSMSMSTIVAQGAFGPSMTLTARSVLFQSLGWSPGFSHGSHTPNRGVVEADATLLFEVHLSRRNLPSLINQSDNVRPATGGDVAERCLDGGSSVSVAADVFGDGRLAVIPSYERQG